jgi:hypothetical protein
MQLSIYSNPQFETESEDYLKEASMAFLTQLASQS